MPKYLLKTSYTVAGAQGLLKDGGSKRRAVAEAAVKKLGGRIESFYFALGESDAVVIVDLPDVVSCAALSVAVAASGGVSLSTTQLLTVQDLDQACKKRTGYTPPGA
jgi:uncharacterized protein with GYD domain